MFICALAFLVIGAYVFWTNYKSEAHQAFFALCLTTCLWQFSWGILQFAKSDFYINSIINLGYTSVLLMPVAFFWFISAILNKKNESKYIVGSLFFSSLLILALWFSNLFVDGYYTYSWGIYPKANWLLHPIHLLIINVLVLRAIILLWKSIKFDFGEKRTQSKYILMGLLVYLVAALDYLCNYGIGLFPFGGIFTLGFLLIVSYSMARHNLLSISLAVSRGITLASVAVLFLIGFIPLTHFLSEADSSEEKILIFFSFFVFSVIASAVIETLKSKLRKYPEKLIMGEEFDSEEKAKEFAETIRRETNMESLLQSIGINLKFYLNLFDVHIYIRQEDGRYHRENIYNEPSFGSGMIDGDSELLPLLKNGGKAVYKQESDQEIRSVFYRLNSVVAVPIMELKELSAICMLSEKEHGNFNAMNMRFLELVIPAINSVFFTMKKHQLQADLLKKTQKIASMMSLMGQYNHDLKGTLLMPMQRIEFLQDWIDAGDITYERAYNEVAKTIFELSERSEKMIKKMSDVMQGDREFKLQVINPNTIIENAIQTFNIKGIKINFELASDIPMVEVDVEDFEMVIINIIKNAREAMYNDEQLERRVKEGGSPLLTISTRYDEESESVLMIFADNGPGIPKEVMQAFEENRALSTKKNGNGVGLLTVKRIIKENNCKLNLISNSEKGTMFMIHMPVVG